MPKPIAAAALCLLLAAVATARPVRHPHRAGTKADAPAAAATPAEPAPAGAAPAEPKPADAAPPAKVAEAEPWTGPVEAFLASMKAGKGRDAVQTVVLSTSLWGKHPGVTEEILGQIDAVGQAYGPVLGYERLATEKLGTMAVREYYLVQHAEMVTRWEFDLVRTPNGWTVGYFGFSDRPNLWFPGGGDAEQPAAPPPARPASGKAAPAGS